MCTGFLKKRVCNADDQPCFGWQFVDQYGKVAVLHCEVWTHVARKGDLKKGEGT